MAHQRPLWRRVVDAGEQALSGPLEGLVQHDAFGVTLTIASRGITTVRSRAERASRQVLHAFNVPAASDINRLLTHIADVERELRQLRQSVSTGTPLERTPTRPRALRSTEDGV